jgi:hypothetical protein
MKNDDLKKNFNITLNPAVKGINYGTNIYNRHGIRDG